MSSSTLAAGLRCLRGKLASQQHNDESDEQLLHAFTTRRDDSAFAVLVRRHGPMVLHVCRRVLGHPHDAEDAFQATFLVLARNAASLRNKNALASWLHGTAYRIALKAKQTAARRHKHEGALGTLMQCHSPADPAEELSWREVQTLLDEEIAHLPEIYRSVFVLCCLENLSQEAVGRRLGLKQRTVSNRLAQARKWLSRRLARRGVELTALLAAATLGSTLSAGLMARTVEAVAAGNGLASVVSASVAELVRGAAPGMVSKTKIATVMLLAAALLGSAGAWLGERHSVSPPVAASTGGLTPRRSPETTQNVEIQGRVLDPEGKPALGATVYVNPAAEGKESIISTKTGEEGRFSLLVPQSTLIVPQLSIPRTTITVVATAKGCGPDWRDVPIDDLNKEMSLRLVKDDVPIEGRILSLEGKPLAGIQVSVQAIKRFPKGDFDRVLRAERNGTQVGNVTEERRLWLTNVHPARTGTTDADGRFRIDGIGRERIAQLHLEGPRIHYSSLEVMTRKGESVQGPNNREPIHPANFEYLAKPSRLVRGTVREKGTGKPIAGIRIGSNVTMAHTVTDAQGRYELHGCAKGDHYGITAFPMNGQPYFFASAEIKDTEGLGPLTADLEMVRGIPFEGKVLDGETGKPVLGGISYYPLSPNPNVTGFIGGGAAHTLGPYSEASISTDGSFHCIVLPGPGFIGVQARKEKRYISACVDPRTIKAGYDKETLLIPFHGGLVTGTPQEQFQGILLINPAKDSKTIAETIRLAVAPEIKGTLLDLEGKPVTGARVRGLEESYSWGTLASEKFSISGVNPERRRRVSFVHAARRLIGSVEIKGKETKPLTVRMQPWAAVRGRLVDTEGRPVRNSVLYANEFLMENGRTDKDGRFLLEGLIPGRSYDLTYQKDKPFSAGTVLKRFVGKPGEVHDLGDVRGQPIRQE
jgi:RNA polymerase sigma factor (sigma-70 family)